MTGPLGNSEFYFPRISMKIHCSPRDQSLSVNWITYVCKYTVSACQNGVDLYVYKDSNTRIIIWLGFVAVITRALIG